jgi:hypothetical protein
MPNDEKQVADVIPNIPMKLWAYHHWYMLLYVSTNIDEFGFFQIGADKFMRTNGSNFEVINELCPNPKRAYKNCKNFCIMGIKESTKLANKKTIKMHDDWCCIHDMLVEELFEQGNQFNPGEKLRFSMVGVQVAAKLKKYVNSNGSCEGFRLKEKYF